MATRFSAATDLLIGDESDHKQQHLHYIADHNHNMSQSAYPSMAYLPPSYQPYTNHPLPSPSGVDQNTFSRDVAFQIPGFLTGPMATHGGADVFNGNDVTDFGPDFAAWYDHGANSKPDPSPFQPNYGFPTSYAPPALAYHAHTGNSLGYTSVYPEEFDSAESVPNSTAVPSQTHSDLDSGPSSAELSPIVELPFETAIPSALPPNPFQSLRLPIDQSNPFGLYSTTGFDMIGVLAKVVSRPNPVITLGPVDLTCSFTVVDIRRFDSPIVYASPTFLRLTGYTGDEVINKNCRFLQSPSGFVERGSPRHYTDPAAVAHLRKSLAAQKECQASLINYRKGGQPFINLVSIVPISWGDSDDIVYHVGFQVDLVEQPHAILHEMQNGKYVFNYSVSPPLRVDDRSLRKEAGVSAEMRSMMHSMAQRSLGTQQVTDDQVLQELHSTLLENSDDFIHVLSLKGHFLYVSSSVTRILEYTAEDLLGKAIADICHPSDIVSVLRELKESTHSSMDEPEPQSQQPFFQGTKRPLYSPMLSAGKPVHLLLRVRRKYSGYIWLDCAGRLYVEQIKGRKAIVLTGRKREMPRLAWSTIARSGGLVESAFWAKTSIDGHFLAVNANALQDVFGWSAEDMIGSNLPYDWVADAAERESLRAAMHSTAASGQPMRVSCRMGGTTRLRAPQPVAICFYPFEELDDPLDRRRMPSELMCQVMSLTSGTLVVHTPAASGQLDENVFAELETARSTSFQYEFQQKRNENAALQAELETLYGRPMSERHRR